MLLFGVAPGAKPCGPHVWALGVARGGQSRPHATPDILPIPKFCTHLHDGRIAGPPVVRAGGRLGYEARRLAPPAALHNPDA